MAILLNIKTSEIPYLRGFKYPTSPIRRKWRHPTNPVWDSISCGNDLCVPIKPIIENEFSNWFGMARLFTTTLRSRYTCIRSTCKFQWNRCEYIMHNIHSFIHTYIHTYIHSYIHTFIINIHTYIIMHLCLSKLQK